MVILQRECEPIGLGQSP